MAAFTSPNYQDRAAYLTKWARLMKELTVHFQTVMHEGEVVGCVVKFEMEGKAEITYAIGKEHWGKGIATAAMQAFLRLETMRPLHGRVAHDNVGSIRVLEKAGFERIGQEYSYAEARGEKIWEYVYRLDQ